MVSTLAFRHGQSLANAVNTLIAQGKQSEIPENFWGIPDNAFPLTKEGIEQARALKAFLPTLFGSQRVLPVTSPFHRASQTAAIVLPFADWQIEEGFVERDFGDVNSYRKRGNPAELFGEFRRSFAEPDYVPFGNGQTFRIVVDRVAEAWKKWGEMAECLQADLLVISCHGETLRALRAVAFQANLDQYDAEFGGKIHNCQVEYFSLRAPESETLGLWHRSFQPPYDQENEWTKIH